MLYTRLYYVDEKPISLFIQLYLLITSFNDILVSCTLVTNFNTSTIHPIKYAYNFDVLYVVVLAFSIVIGLPILFRVSSMQLPQCQ